MNDIEAAPVSTAARYVGWFRVRGGRWQALTSAPDAATAFKALLAATRGTKHAEVVVLIEGRHPLDPR